MFAQFCAIVIKGDQNISNESTKSISCLVRLAVIPGGSEGGEGERGGGMSQ